MTSDASPVPGGNLPTLPVKRVVRPTPSIPDHEVVRQIGSGAYGEVWLAKALTGAWRAVKIVWREDFEDERTFNREFEGILQYELSPATIRDWCTSCMWAATTKAPPSIIT